MFRRQHVEHKPSSADKEKPTNNKIVKHKEVMVRRSG